MSSSIKQIINDRQETIAAIEKCFSNALQCYVIHYSCESFYNLQGGQSTRITSIAIRNLGSAQTHHWALNRSAELLKLNVSDPANLDTLEHHLLKNYFDFLSRYATCTFMHWNMRDNNYGFQALQHRFEVLAGTPFILSDDRKLDLARAAVSIYGRNYIAHAAKNGRSGRLLALVEKNHIADKDVMTGQEEAEAYINGKYRELEMSTLRKVDILCNIAERMHDRTLETNSVWYKPRSFHPYWLFNRLKEHPVMSGLVAIGILIGVISKSLDLYSKFQH
ncbi:TPA: hypothetical protein ACN7VF_000031 [Klebsiella pneumoniae]|uniref:hypothetical protein n=1 Tax=Klebsiella pneumoniae TaxID=573 RepID=UPI000E2E4108|nr:hypothetical protein [Klebsiella pneumoniae]MCP6587622.1 hypothetical protein [Klebsiella pneumoniae]MDT9831302.1 hypothetical protein [Klebsiella pneumoniae]SWP18453.1 Uncharacterised protein [Klebsiella pneumoniae]